MAKGFGIDHGVLKEVFGGEASKVIKVIGTPMFDKDISQKLDFETSRVRAILNELLVKNLVQLDRNRYDTGYCDYYWVRREDKIRAYVDYYVSKKISKLEKNLADPDDIVFECGCERVDYAKALDENFICTSCGRNYKQVNSAKGSRKIKAEIRRLEALKNAS